MQEMNLKLKRQIESVSMVNNANIEKAVLNFFIWSFVVLAVLYLIFLGTMISNIVERRSLEANARILGTQVGDLELRYLAMSNNVDITMSHEMGFKEAKVNFATRKSVGFRSSPNLNISQNDI